MKHTSNTQYSSEHELIIQELIAALQAEVDETEPNALDILHQQYVEYGTINDDLWAKLVDEAKSRFRPKAERNKDGSVLIPIDSLLSFDRANDPSSLIGKRWLCRGGSLVLQGPTGVGKSSLLMQMAITFALGKNLFRDLKPERPFKFLVIQAENDLGDLAEPFQDITRVYGGEWIHGAGGYGDAEEKPNLL